MAEVKANHNRAMAKQKKLHDTELSKMIRDHEAELEEQAVQVQEARTVAQSAKKVHQYAEREYKWAKTSCTLQARRMKDMEDKERRCVRLLRNMDEQLVGKFILPRLSAEPAGPSVLYS